MTALLSITSRLPSSAEGTTTSMRIPPIPVTDTKGRAVCVVDVSNGTLVWSYTNARNSTTKYCIPSDVAGLDTNGDGYVERLYVGDVGGQLWRFDIGDSDGDNGEDDADAHLKRQVMGREVVVAITEGRLDFGPWEQIFYGEFDGKRKKRVLVKIIGE